MRACTTAGGAVMFIPDEISRKKTQEKTEAKVFDVTVKSKAYSKVKEVSNKILRKAA